QVSNRAAADEWLGDLVHLNGGLHPGINTLLLERVLQSKRVNHRSQHAHVIGGDTVHVPRLLGDSAEEIAAPNHDSQLHLERVNVGKFSCDFVDAGGVDPKALVGRQGLARKLQQYTLENWFVHVFEILSRKIKKGTLRCPFSLLSLLFWLGDGHGFA